MREHPNDDTLQAYLDDELAKRERVGLETHLQACPECKADLARLRSLFSSIESLPSEALTTDLVSSVLAAIRPNANWLPSLALGELLAAAALTLVLVLWLGGVELQGRLAGAVQRLVGQLELATVGLSTTLNDLLVQVPDTPELSLFGLGGLVDNVLVSPSMLWIVGATAFALLLLGNGLVLRMGKDSNA